ncbi:hypothetical protein SAMN05443574_13614 [Haloarcula vallismortis]|uniref:Uncharacterized protein n=2 Tax=Haloarcula vallismortis TaxID=28442 RepID=M0JPK6_HALVA|nr:hypothetical protein [Haloarcula vallismortis]EMA09610.1 hypothetical protein C437_05455 [Haloarcula vallismortis ATCC 29715]SDX36220.1 hypothetical protein SAMN05443574_13614 [Haloarcula vallismortis]
MGEKRPDGFDWQSCIEGVGVIEFFQLDNQENFIEAINPYLPEDNKIHGYHPRETHARVPFQLRDLRREVSFPGIEETLFNSVQLQIAVDTNDLARVLFFGDIDTERFVAERSERYEDSGHELRLQNHGLEALRDAQTKLSQFLRDDVNAGFFTNSVEPWAKGTREERDHPGIWFYDFSEAEPSTLDEFQQKCQDQTPFIGLGKENHVEQGFTPYANSRCVVHGDGREYWATQLGSFPFRYFLLRFQEQDRSDLPFDLESPDSGIPDDVTRGYVPLARSYAHLFWSIASYDALESLAPEAQFESGDIQDVLSNMSDREKADLLSDLYEGSRLVDEFWHSRQEQFSSIKTMRTEDGGYAEREDAVTKPLLEAAEDIEALSEDQVSRFSNRYQRLIDRVQTHIETNVGIVGKKLSLVLFVLTVANVVAQFPAILSNEYSNAILAAFGVLAVLALLLIFPPGELRSLQ